MKCEEITKMLRIIESKGPVDQIRLLGAIEMTAKRLKEEAGKVKEKMQRQQDERISRKIF